MKALPTNSNGVSENNWGSCVYNEIQEIYACFIDFGELLDRVQHEDLRRVLINRNMENSHSNYM